MKNPIVLLNSVSDKGLVLQRSDIGSKEQRDEGWFQDILFSHANLLPVEEFDNTISGLVPLAKELGVEAGSVDLVYLGVPNGRLVIVETKLIRNPEMHRSVVAQTIDYAQCVARLEFSELADAINKARIPCPGESSDSFDHILSQVSDKLSLEKHELIERIMQNLERGDLLLLIVGDRISPKAALLGSAISGAPGLEFQLGLVEIVFYRLSQEKEWPLIAVADVVGKTLEKDRAVVRVRYEEKKPQIDVDVVEDLDGKRARSPMNSKKFLALTSEHLRPVFSRWFMKWETERRIKVVWNPSNFSVRGVFPNLERWIYSCYPDGGYVFMSKSDANKSGVSADNYAMYLKARKEIPAAKSFLDSGSSWVRFVALPPEELDRIFALFKFLLAKEA